MGRKPKNLKQNRSYPNCLIKQFPVGIQTLKLCSVCRVGWHQRLQSYDMGFTIFQILSNDLQIDAHSFYIQSATSESFPLPPGQTTLINQCKHIELSVTTPSSLNYSHDSFSVCLKDDLIKSHWTSTAYHMQRLKPKQLFKKKFKKLTFFKSETAVRFCFLCCSPGVDRPGSSWLECQVEVHPSWQTVPLWRSVFYVWSHRHWKSPSSLISNPEGVHRIT